MSKKLLAALRIEILAAWYAGDVQRYLALIAQHNRMVSTEHGGEERCLGSR